MELKRSQLARGSGALLAVFLTTNAYPCGQGSGTPSILPTLGGSVIQPNAINQAGNVTGFSYLSGDANAHAFLYNTGTSLDLGSLDGLVSVGNAINASGQVAGYSSFDNSFTHGFLTSSGSVIDLGTLGGTYSYAYGLNDFGLVVGESGIEFDLEIHGFSYNNGIVTDLGTLGGMYSSARAVNNSGTIVGESSDDDEFVHAFSYSGGIMTDLGTLGGDASTAKAINSNGIIIGESSNANDETHGFSFSGGAMTDIGTLGGTFSNVKALNETGQIIGISSTVIDDTHGYLYSNGTLTDLGTLGGVFSQPESLNNQGQIVGESDLANGTQHAFLWQNGTMVDLNSLIPANSGWELFTAGLINDAGRIVGFGTYNGNFSAYVLDLGTANNAPIANAGAEQTVDCQTAVTLSAAGSSDPDGDVLTYQWTQGSTVLGTNVTLVGSFDLGNHTITLTVTDACGASSQTNVALHVSDSTAPTITCPAPASVSADANCQGIVPNLTTSAVVSDNCAAPASLVVMQNPAPGTVVGLGSHPITLTVSDASGNQNSCSTSFSVVDTTAPVIISGPALGNVGVGANCVAIVPSVINQIVAADNCTPANQLTITQNPAAGSTVGAGLQTIIVTVKDAANNSVSGSLSFTVVDSTAPSIVSVGSPLTVAADANCQAVLPNLLGNVVASDNCTPANQLVITQNPVAGTVLPHGQHTITITVTDAAGNSSTGSVLFTVADQTAPVIQSVTATPNNLGSPNGAMIPVTVSVVAADNCDASPVNKIISITANESVNPGDIQITGNLTATLEADRNPSGNGRIYTITVESKDAAGNASTSTVTVTVPKGGNGNGNGNGPKNR